MAEWSIKGYEDYTLTGKARIRYSKFKKTPPKIIKKVSKNKAKLRKKNSVRFVSKY